MKALRTSRCITHLNMRAITQCAGCCLEASTNGFIWFKVRDYRAIAFMTVGRHTYWPYVSDTACRKAIYYCLQYGVPITHVCNVINAILFELAGTTVDSLPHSSTVSQ